MTVEPFDAEEYEELIELIALPYVEETARYHARGTIRIGQFAEALERIRQWATNIAEDPRALKLYRQRERGMILETEFHGQVARTWEGLDL